MNAKLTQLLQKLRNDERGLSTVEYVVLLVLIVAIAVAVWNLFGQSLVGKLHGAATTFDREVTVEKSGEVTKSVTVEGWDEAKPAGE